MTLPLPTHKCKNPKCGTTFERRLLKARPEGPKYCSQACQTIMKIGVKRPEIAEACRRAKLGIPLSEDHKKSLSVSALDKFATTRVPTGYKLFKDGVGFHSKYEIATYDRLNELGIRFEMETRLPWVDKKGTKRTYFPDFYLPDYDVYIECKCAWYEMLAVDKNNYIIENYPKVVYLRDKVACGEFTLQSILATKRENILKWQSPTFFDRCALFAQVLIKGGLNADKYPQERV